MWGSSGSEGQRTPQTERKSLIPLETRALPPHLSGNRRSLARSQQGSRPFPCAQKGARAPLRAQCSRPARSITRTPLKYPQKAIPGPLHLNNLSRANSNSRCACSVSSNIRFNLSILESRSSLALLISPRHSSLLAVSSFNLAMTNSEMITL